MYRVKVAIIGVACAILTACGAGPKLGEGSSAVTVASTLPAPDKTGMSVDLSNYRLGPLDDIKIEVFGAPELTRAGEVDAAGNFAGRRRLRVVGVGEAARDARTDRSQRNSRRRIDAAKASALQGSR